MPLTTEEVRRCPPPGGCGGHWVVVLGDQMGWGTPRSPLLSPQGEDRASVKSFWPWLLGAGCAVWCFGVRARGPPAHPIAVHGAPGAARRWQAKGCVLGAGGAAQIPSGRRQRWLGLFWGAHLRVCGRTWGRFAVRRSGEETCPAAGMMDGISGTTTMRSLRRRTAEYGHTRPWVLFFFFPGLPGQAGREIAAGTWAVGRAGSGPRPGVRSGGPWGTPACCTARALAALRASVSPLAHCSTAWGSCTPSASTATRRARRARVWRW